MYFPIKVSKKLKPSYREERDRERRDEGERQRGERETEMKEREMRESSSETSRQVITGMCLQPGSQPVS